MFRLALWTTLAVMAAFLLVAGIFAPSAQVSSGGDAAVACSMDSPASPVGPGEEQAPEGPADDQQSDASEEDSDDRDGVLTPEVEFTVAVIEQLWAVPRDKAGPSSIPDRRYRPPWVA